MAVTFRGDCSWSDIAYLPEPGKNEYGVDTLIRTFQGRADQYAAFLQTLNQRSTFNFAGGQYYLQTWRPEDHRTFPKVILSYKGLINGRLPDPRYTDGTSQKSVTKTATVNNQERTYEILYVSPQTTCRYISASKGYGLMPLIPVSLPGVISSYYTDPNTNRKKSGYPPGLSFITLIDSKSQEPIDGTPWYETEVVASGIIAG